MKKILKTLTLIGTLLSIVGCKTSSEIIINVVSLNDAHGALLETHATAGLIKGASYIESVQKENKKGTIVLSAGDMYQGTAVSNIEKGNTMIECMNALNFDAMTIGNHEFDWGEQVIINHHDGDLENGEANYPYLACNIFYNNGTEDTSDDTRVDWCKDYIVIERKDVKIGVMGWLADSCRDDIAETIVNKFAFHNPLDILEETSRKLRQEEGCHVVIAMGHEGADLNLSIMGFDKESKVDLIINGHSHTYYTNDKGIPSVQSGSSLAYIANTTIKLDRTTKEVLEVIPYQEEITPEMKESRKIKRILDERLENYQYLYEPITIAASSLTSTKVGQWVADCVRKSTDSDVGIVNAGGIRAAGFPINKGEEINEDRMWTIMPFDNEINTCYLTGRQIRGLKSNSDGFVFDVDYRNTEFEDDKLYKVAACDYVFNKPNYPFLNGEEVVETKILVRDVMIQDLKLWQQSGNDWDASKSLIN